MTEQNGTRYWFKVSDVRDGTYYFVDNWTQGNDKTDRSAIEAAWAAFIEEGERCVQMGMVCVQVLNAEIPGPVKGTIEREKA